LEIVHLGKLIYFYNIYHNFSKKTIPLIGINYRSNKIEIDSKTIILQVCDATGQKRYQLIIKQYFLDANGILVIFDDFN
jgi:GTPase SAR1 family protein